MFYLMTYYISNNKKLLHLICHFNYLCDKITYNPKVNDNTTKQPNAI